MSSRRTSSRRRAPKKAATLPVGITTGIASMVEGNESTIASMLSTDDVGDTKKDSADARAKLAASLADCMAVNDLSAEALLARFFDASVLRAYCERRLCVSSKGNEATLAARIARAWSRPDFRPLPLADADSGGKEMASAAKKSAKRAAKDEESGGIEKKRKMWTVTRKDPFDVKIPPGPLGLTIKRYDDEFIVTEVSKSVHKGPFPKIRPGDAIVSVDGSKIESEDDDRLKDSGENRVIRIGERVIANDAAAHSRGSLLHMKEAGLPLFDIMDYSDVADTHGQDFLDELSPRNKGKMGKQILGEAWASFRKSR